MLILHRDHTKHCSDKCKQAGYENQTSSRETHKIYTIGYEKRDLPEIIGILKDNGIEWVLDIRFSTSSRFKQDFSDRTLKNALPDEGITYTSNKSLGVPFRIQKLYKKVKCPFLNLKDFTLST